MAHLSIKRLQDHLRCLEHDKTKLVREIQKLKREPVYIPYNVPATSVYAPQWDKKRITYFRDFEP